LIDAHHDASAHLHCVKRAIWLGLPERGVRRSQRHCND
jgi:hypothetical protein